MFLSLAPSFFSLSLVFFFFNNSQPTGSFFFLPSLLTYKLFARGI